MSHNRSLRKTVAYMLIAAMLNPAAMLPAYALDTDIFLNPPTGSVFGEPNIMIVLDTSDSMWIPEPWHEIEEGELVNKNNVEDPANYDSHYEYLWNDSAFIHSIGCNVGNCDIGADRYTNAGKNLPRFPDYNSAMRTMPQGFFKGADAAARGALKQSAANHAAGTTAGDPGLRGTYRNYGGGATSTIAGPAMYDSSWVYWLPAGTPETDLRLMSTSPSRAPLGSRVTRFSSKNGLNTDPVERGGILYANMADNAFDNFNLATLTYQQAFTPPPPATGIGAANKCTASYANLLPSTVYAPGPYAKNTGKWLDKQWVRYERFLGLDNSRVVSFPSSAAGDLAFRQWIDTTLVPAYFNGNINTSPNHLGIAPALTQMIDHDFLPIRTEGSGYAGWTDLRTDMGGFNYRHWLFGIPDSGPSNTILVNTLAAFGITSTPLQARVRALVRTFETGAHVSSNPLCTDAASCALAGVSLGVPAYLDTKGGHPDPTVVVAPTVCEWSPSDGRLFAGVDAKNPTNLSYRSGAPGSATNPSCVKVSGPGSCSVTGGVQWSPNDNRDSSWVGRSTLVAEGNTYFHGGTCQGRCSYGTGDAALCPAGASASPGPGTTSTFQPAPQYSDKMVTHASLVVGTQTLFDVRTDNITAGCTDKTDLTTVACNVRTPGCVDATYSVACTAAPPAASTELKEAYEQGSNNDAVLVHDCLDDNNTAGNPSGSFIIANQRTFGGAYNTTVGSGAASASAAYTTSSGLSYAAAPAKKVDMYSVNYLNWKYGPRGPNGRQIARKTRMQIAKDALATLVEKTNGVRYGLMVFNGLPADNTKQGSEGSQGARVVYPITRMGSSLTDTPDVNNRATLITRIFAQEAKAATPLTESVYEAMLYFSGRAPRFGTNAAISSNFSATSQVAQGGGNVADGADPTAICTGVGAQCAAAGIYKSPMLNNPTAAAPASCQRNFIVLITDGGPDRDRDANTQIQNTEWAESATVNLSARTTIDTTQADTVTDQFEASPGVPFGPVSDADTAFSGGYVWLDELASFMDRADLSPGSRIFNGDTGTDTIAGRQPVKLFTIGFAGVASPVLANAATGLFATAESSAQLQAALEDAVNNARNSNAVVAAPSIPISASNRAENSTDVYLAFFKPDTRQAWNGTLKKYKLGIHALEANVCGVDASNNPIQVCLTGQTELCGPGCKNIERTVTDPGPPPTTTIGVDPAAVSFWSSPATPDGGNPDQGGSGYVLKNTGTPATRKVYTHLSSQLNPLLTADVNKVLETNATITKTVLGDAAMSDATRTTLINFIRGGDNGAANCTTPLTPCDTWRNWAHAGVVHSAPTVVTYSATQQVVFYLSVDGLLHAVDTATGEEKWSFLVEEAFPQLSALMANGSGPPIQIADGSISFFHKDHNGDGLVNNLGGTDQVFLFFGLRRGGRAYYALDITDSANPVFKWKITNTQLCSPGACSPSPYGKLGQTWSKPVVARLHETSIQASGFPALVFSGGYDPNQDTTPPPAVPTDTMGHALYVANMTDGSLVMEFSDANVAGGMLSAIPSDPAVLNTNLDSQGFVDRIYVGDVAGNVYRFDVDDSNKVNWTGKKLAILSDTSPPNRKIFFPPVVVKQNVPVPHDAVFVGTGDREHPLLMDVAPGVPTSDKMFMIMDKDTGLTSDPTYVVSFPAGDFVDATAGAGVSISAAAAFNTQKGWYSSLQQGEKVTGSPSVFGDLLRFPSYLPEGSNECRTGGESRLNELNATTGAFTIIVAGTPVRFHPGTSSGYLSGTIQILVGGKVFEVTFGIGEGQTGSLVPQAKQSPTNRLGRVYWYMEPEL